MLQHKRFVFSVAMIGTMHFAAPVLADPEWIECTINEVSVLSSHLEVSCSAIYVATNPPSQGKQAISSGLASRGPVASASQGRAPQASQGRAPRSTGQQTREPRVDKQRKGTQPVEIGQRGARPSVTVSDPISLSPEKNAVRVYAVAHSNPAAQAILQLLLAAQQPGLTLQIKTDYADISGVSLGCPERDCRLIQEARVFSTR